MFDPLKKLLTRTLRQAGRLSNYIERPGLFELRKRGIDVPLYEKLTAPWVNADRFRAVIDIGANEGQFAKVALNAFPGSKIIAFEPLPDCYESMVSKFNGESRFEAHNLALGDARCEMQFNRHSFTPASSFLKLSSAQASAFPYTADATTMKVHCDRLDDVINPDTLIGPVFIKIDVQGYEANVVKGAIAHLKKAEMVMIECALQPMYESQPPVLDLLQRLDNLGLRLAGVVDQLGEPATGKPLQLDFLWVREGD